MAITHKLNRKIMRTDDAIKYSEETATAFTASQTSVGVTIAQTVSGRPSETCELEEALVCQFTNQNSKEHVAKSL